MAGSVFAGCTEACGWTAAIVATLAFGSFGVPIKAASSVEVDPLVMQVCQWIVVHDFETHHPSHILHIYSPTRLSFVSLHVGSSSFSVRLHLDISCLFDILERKFLININKGEEIRWTNWGILSGMFWVPAAACGIYGIRNAGLAIAVGTWSSMNVIMSMIWGILVFHERFNNLVNTGMAFTTLIIGLLGMSQYSKPPSSPTPVVATKTVDEATDLESEQTQQAQDDSKTSHFSKRKPMDVSSSSTPSRPPVSGNMMLLSSSFDSESSVALLGETKERGDKDRFIWFGGRVALTRRQLGILGAVINGGWGGLNLVPLHFAKREGFGGAAYLISFACGSMIVNTMLWVLYFLYHLQQKRCAFREALYCLPDWHLDKLWLPGFLAGSLYSLGNFGSILSVTYLGQGVGFSLCQVQILVSGLWGIFYYKEIRGREVIMKWLISACITVIGILWLSHEHSGGSMGGHRL